RDTAIARGSFRRRPEITVDSVRFPRVRRVRCAPAPPEDGPGRGVRYFAGGVNGALMVVTYWIAAPTATGAAMRTCPASAPSEPTARMPPRQPTAAAGMNGPNSPMMVAEATVAPTTPPSTQPTAAPPMPPTSAPI